MSWTTPKTWTAETLTSNDLNTHLRDNLNALKTPGSAVYNGVESSDLSLASTTWADVDATEGKFQHTITTTGGDVMVGFGASFRTSATAAIYFDVAIDGTAWGATTLGVADGIHGVALDNNSAPVEGHINLFRIITGISAGSHIFKLRYKVSTGTTTLLLGAGTANGDIAAQFWVREIS